MKTYKRKVQTELWEGFPLFDENILLPMKIVKFLCPKCICLLYAKGRATMSRTGKKVLEKG